MCILRPVKTSTRQNDKTHLKIHDNTSFNSSKSHFPLPTSLYCQEKWCLEFWKNNQLDQMKNSNDIRAQTRSRKLVKLSAE